MTKPYHLTPEQTLRIWEDTIRNLKGDENIYQSFANAALDKVLGEPVGEVVNLNNQPVGTPSLTENGWSLKVGQKLYTPKEMK